MAKTTKKNSSKKSKARKTSGADAEPRYDFSMENRTKRIVVALLFLLLAVVTILGLLGKAGAIGNGFVQIIRQLIGAGVYLIPIVFLGITIQGLRVREGGVLNIPRALAHIVLVLAGAGIIEALAPDLGGGGWFGRIASTPLVRGFDNLAAVLIMFVLFGMSLVVAFRWYPRLPRWQSKNKTSRADSSDEHDTVRVTGVEGLEQTQVNKKQEANPPAEDTLEKQTPATINIGEKAVKKISEKKKKSEELVMNTAALPSSYTLPPLSLLPSSSGKADVGNIQSAAETITQTLGNFGVDVTMDEISVGPTVTRFAMKPAVGTKLAKIKGLDSELALALAAHPIRIEAPIPGKSLVGIEIPNKKSTIVGLGSMLAEKEFQNTDKPLLVSLGKSVSGKAYYANIAKMPHMLIAGATGAGKSVTVHNIILSLLYAHGPEAVRFLMIDPKRVELTLYDGIPHLLTPVIKQAKKAILALKWATQEMDRRYDVLEQHQVRDIGSYHSSIVEKAYADAPENIEESDVELPERMPYIVVVIDEMADLMTLYPRELEASIVRLAQMSRAVGIHLLLSTQRPSVNVITGLIKANIPARMALRVASQIDSRTILDAAGAETLLGRGDMLYKGGDMSKPDRIQCALVEEDQIKKIVKHIIKHNRGEVFEEIDLPERMEGATIGAGSNYGDDDDDGDELLGDARDLVVRSRKASTSYIQRKLRVGYSRAARLMDMLEEAGVVGPANGAKGREVLVSNDDGSRPEGDSPEDDIMGVAGDNDQSGLLG